MAPELCLANGLVIAASFWLKDTVDVDRRGDRMRLSLVLCLTWSGWLDDVRDAAGMIADCLSPPKMRVQSGCGGSPDTGRLSASSTV